MRDLAPHSLLLLWNVLSLLDLYHVLKIIQVPVSRETTVVATQMQGNWAPVMTKDDVVRKEKGKKTHL